MKLQQTKIFLRILSRLAFSFFLYCSTLNYVYAESEKILRVGVSNNPPWGIIQGDKFGGICVDIWMQINNYLHFPYKFVAVEKNITKAVDSLHKGEIDLLLGPVSANYDRSLLVQFTRPYAINQFGLVYLVENVSFFHILGTIFKKIFSYSVLIAIIFISLYATFMWYFEKNLWIKEDTGFFKGISRIIWIILLKKGAAPDVPSTLIGKFAHLIWVAGGTILLSLLYGIIISSLQFSLDKTNRNLDGDPSHKLVVALAGSEAIGYARAAGYEVSEVKNIQMGINDLLEKKADFFAGYSITFNYYINKYSLSKKLAISPKVLKTSILAFALPIGSPLVAKIDSELARMEDMGTVTKICEKYVSKRIASDCL